MRTFHTGGVFLGDFTKQIRAPFTGTLKYSLKGHIPIVKTIHGEKGFRLMKGIKIYLENTTHTLCSLDIPRGSILLANNAKKVYYNQVLAEIKKKAHLILEKDYREMYSEVSGELFFQSLAREKKEGRQKLPKKLSKIVDLIWVLYGDRYRLQSSSTLDFKLGENFTQNTILETQKIKNIYPGIVKFDNVTTTQEINIVNSSVRIENGRLIERLSQFNLLQLTFSNKISLFKLRVKEQNLIKHGQIIGCLKEKDYKTKTGGTIYYSTVYSQSKDLFTGFLYWVPEEIYPLNYSMRKKTLFKKNGNVHNGSFVKKGTKLLHNIFSKLDGVVQINDNFSELMVKPGSLCSIENKQKIFVKKNNRFFHPGEKIMQHQKISTLLYLEFIDFQGSNYFLLRPVIIYKISKKKAFLINSRFFHNLKNKSVAFRTVKKIFLKNGERFKSCIGVNLIKTLLVVDIQSKYSMLSARIQALQQKHSKNGYLNYNLKLILYEQIKISDFILQDTNIQERVIFTKVAKNYQYVVIKTVLARRKILTTAGGTIVSINNKELRIVISEDALPIWTTKPFM
jgi:hypothetical protein